eukprot:1853737-Pleurochrysis_carterae.AAC.1
MQVTDHGNLRALAACADIMRRLNKSLCVCARPYDELQAGACASPWCVLMQTRALRGSMWKKGAPPMFVSRILAFRFKRARNCACAQNSTAAHKRKRAVDRILGCFERLCLQRSTSARASADACALTSYLHPHP